MANRATIFALSLLACAWPARAATVRLVNKDKTKVLLELTQAELAAVEEDDEVIVEVSKPRFVIAGTLEKLNPVKKTIVLALEAAEPRFAKKQNVRFLSPFWNPVFSPLLFSPAQYHQYARSSVHAGLGGFYEASQVKVEESKTKTTVQGGRFLADGYLHLPPGWGGVLFGYERREASLVSKTDDDKTKMDLVFNQVRPGAWYEFVDRWRLGLRYDYTLYDLTYKGQDGDRFYFEFGEPILGLTNYGADYEWGVTYKDKSKYQAVDTKKQADGSTVDVKATIKMPAEARVHFRSVSSPMFIWGASLAYVFFERELEKGDELRAKPGPAEVVRGQLSFETRFDDGDKLDWILTYDGGKARSLSNLENTANMGGFTLAYQTPAFEKLLLGGQLDLRYGAITLEDQVSDGKGGVTAVDRKVTAYDGSLLLFGQFEYDALGRRRGR